MEGVLARIETGSADAMALLQEFVRTNSVNPAFAAACDGPLYEDEDIPSVVYGPGDLRIAHCKDESVARAEIIAAAKGVAACVLEWCDVP
jgi:acetylornithine deacetylase/succinyl-diaminopimelate desuccinylase-like protein